MNTLSFSGSGIVYPPAPVPVGMMETVYTGPTCGSRWNSIACPDSWYAVILLSLSGTRRLFFSPPIPTLMNDLSTSSFTMKALSDLAALMAASFIRFSRSAPANPAVVLAISC